MSFADVNGQHIYFEDSGGDGAAVLFSHGFLMDHEMFVHQVAALSAEFRRRISATPTR
jgi:3-oxoadipate enol-lactonase